jgi:tellurite methyltransferase
MPTHIDEWNERFRTGQQLLKAPAPLVVQFTDGLAPGVALDLACGPGRNALYLAQRGWRVTGVDSSPVAVELLRAKNPSIDARVVDLEAGEFAVPPDAFDLVLSCYYLQRSLIPLMKSALRPGGLLIMIVNLAGADRPQGTPTRAYAGELAGYFDAWPILHYREDVHRHAIAELVTQKPAGLRSSQ